jgi:hypothetical protein
VLQRVALEDADRRRRSQRGDICLERVKTWRTVFDEVHRSSAARQRFEPHRACTGEEVEHARTRQRGRDLTHDRRAHMLGRWSHTCRRTG